MGTVTAKKSAIAAYRLINEKVILGEIWMLLVASLFKRNMGWGARIIWNLIN